jgi:hypothetical protein
MSSLVDDLNDLLARERGELEAVAELLEELSETDPDLAEGAADALSTERWSISGLYHRIVALHGSPTLEVADFAEEMALAADLKSKLRLLCRAQKSDGRSIRSVLNSEGIDGTTRDFLSDLLRAHEETAAWCDSVVSEWKVAS